MIVIGRPQMQSVQLRRKVSIARAHRDVSPNPGEFGEADADGVWLVFHDRHRVPLAGLRTSERDGSDLTSAVISDKHVTPTI